MHNVNTLPYTQNTYFITVNNFNAASHKVDSGEPRARRDVTQPLITILRLATALLQHLPAALDWIGGQF